MTSNTSWGNKSGTVFDRIDKHSKEITKAVNHFSKLMHEKKSAKEVMPAYEAVAKKIEELAKLRSSVISDTNNKHSVVKLINKVALAGIDVMEEAIEANPRVGITFARISRDMVKKST